MLQLLLRIGTFQLSDIFYNTVGGVLRGLMYCVVMKAKNIYKMRWNCDILGVEAPLRCSKLCTPLGGEHQATILWLAENAKIVTIGFEKINGDKGTPCYKEIEALRDTRFFNLIIGKESYPTDIRDVRKILSMDELIEELRKFDDEKLYPYVVGLLEKLKIAVNPSPMIM